jgi:hypothetical protein
VADCDTDSIWWLQNLRLAVDRRTIKKICVESFNLKKLNEGEVKDQYQVAINK